MKLTYTYNVHGYSGGMMLSNSASGEWILDTLATGTTLVGPNPEVQIVLIGKSADRAMITIKYRNDQSMTSLSLNSIYTFSDSANAYGFSYTFSLKA